MTRRRPDDGGYTLIELLVAAVVGAIVVGTIGTAFVVVLRNTTVTTERLGFSHDLNLLTTYLTPDLASATEAAAGGTDCSGRDNALVLRWSEPVVVPRNDLEARFTTTTAPPAEAATAYVAAYALEGPEPGDGDDLVRWRLRRWLCVDGAVVGDEAAIAVVPELVAPAGGDPPVVVDPAGVTVTLRRWDRDEGRFDLDVAVGGPMGGVR